MQYIAVVDCASSGQMYVDDIIEMGYRPLLIYSPVIEEFAKGWASNIASVKANIGSKGDYVDMAAGESLDSILKRLEPFDIVCVVPGSEPGVRLADQLNHALGLRGNDPDTTYLRCTKEGMCEALVKAGIRHIMTAPVTSEKDVEDFWNVNGLTKAVLKFSESAGTVGLKICSSLEESLAHFRAMHDMHTMVGTNDTPILMQEFIGGTEYIVNSLSIDGRHKITDVWRYEKIIQEDGVLVYDTCILVDRLGPGMQELLQYAYQVLDAVDMKNGFCHNEYKIDNKGPVLIETNARPMGANLTREYLNEIFGTHMTDITLKALLEPTFFANFIKAPYRPRKSAMFKFSIVPAKVKADLGPFFDIVRHLDSYREIVYFGKAGVQEYERTIDLETSPFFIKLINEDYGGLKRDYELLRNLEERYFSMLFADNDHVDGLALRTDLGAILSEIPSSRKAAVFKDDGTTVYFHKETSRSEAWEMHDIVVFARCAESSLTDRFRSMMMAMSQVRKGGIIVIVPEAYRSLPYGVVGAEVLMSIMGFDEEITPSVGNGVLYGLRR